MHFLFAAALTAAPLAGPHRTLDAACAAALAASGTPARPCASTPIATHGSALSAALLHAEDRSDPRFAGSGAFFLALGGDGAWFVTPKPLDRLNGAAGHTYLPELTPSSITVAGARLLLRFVDATSRVCNVCEGAAHHARTFVQTRALVLVCGRDHEGAIACTAPIETDAHARASLTPDGALVIAAPGAAPQRYDVRL